LPASFKIAADSIPEDQRDPNLPLRYNFYRVI
jgi:hypothetical protein